MYNQVYPRKQETNSYLKSTVLAREVERNGEKMIDNVQT